MSIDSRYTLGAFSASMGTLPYPLLADFHPKGAVSKLYDIYNEKGQSLRAAILIDMEGVIRWKKIYETGLPDNDEILNEIAQLAK